MSGGASSRSNLPSYGKLDEVQEVRRIAAISHLTLSFITAKSGAGPIANRSHLHCAAIQQQT